jgi:hypothetical protein
MRTAAPDAIDLSTPAFKPPWVSDPEGALVAPGRYQARLVQVGPEAVKTVGGPRAFRLVPVEDLPEGTDLMAGAAFRAEVNDLLRRLDAVGGVLDEMAERVRYMRAALEQAPAADAGLHLRMDALAADVAGVRETLSGNPARRRLSEFTVPGVAGRLYAAAGALSTRMAPTATQRESLAAGRSGLADVEARTASLRGEALAALEQALAEAGAPWIPGQRVGR